MEVTCQEALMEEESWMGEETSAAEAARRLADAPARVEGVTRV